MGRAPCCDKVGLKKGPWTPEEDQTLISFIQHHGHSNWRALPKQAGLLRCGKSCRLRWINYLRPDIKRGNFSTEEEDTIIQLHEMLGNSFPESTSDHIATSGSPQQSSLTSDDMSSSGTEVSSIEVPSDTSFIMDVQTFDNCIQQLPNLDYLPIIDETFWEPQDLLPSEFDNIMEDNDQMVQFESFFCDEEQNNKFSAQVYDNNVGPVNYGDAKDNMDFWLDVFVQAGGAPELPEF
uniref:Uncharacterized protein n=1 Tax=Chenopodium quinoa TaxID=63459 RepID=A0A803KSX8_CHEQI